MTIKELLDNLEIIRDSLSGGGYEQDLHSKDVDKLMNTIEDEGISGDPEYGGGCCTITLNPGGCE